MPTSRIRDVKVFLVEAKVKGVFRIALGEETIARSLYAIVELDGGTRGYGEGSPYAPVTGETLASSLALASEVGGLLRGRNIDDLGDILSLLDKFLWRSPAAKAALESALLDAFAREHGVPLCSLLGGCRGGRLETDYTISLDEPHVMAKAAREAVEKGFRRLKIKLGGPKHLDLERVKAVRDAVGYDVEILVDANQAWSFSDALWMLGKLEKLDVVLVEQPLKRDDFEGLAQLSKVSGIPIAVDESIYNIRDLVRLYNLGFRGVVNVKVSRVGGPLKAARILQVAEELGLETMIGCMLETGLGILHALHAAYTVKPKFVDLDAPLLLEEDPSGCRVYEKPPLMVRPEAPGVGCTPRVSR